MSVYPQVVSEVFPSGQVHLLGGAPRAGKTAFEAWMCSHVLRGAPFLGHTTNVPPWWGAIVLDRGADDRRTWWRVAGIPHLVTGSSLPLYSITDDPDLGPSALRRMKDLQGFVEKQIDRLKAPPGGVLTIDVANPLAGNSHSSYLSSFAAGWSLSKMAHDRELTIFAIMHGAKQLAGTDRRYVRLTDRIIGSTGFLGAVGTVCYLASHEESGERGYQDFAWEPHHGAAETFRLKRRDDGLFALWQSAAETKERVKQQQEVTAEDVYALVPKHGQGYITTGQVVQKIQELYKVTRRTIERWILKLALDERIVAFEDERGKWVRPPEN